MLRNFLKQINDNLICITCKIIDCHGCQFPNSFLLAFNDINQASFSESSE